MNNRQRMRASNKLVREWLLSNGYDDIWFKPHSKRNDHVFTQRGNYLATDLWNLFDGVCISASGVVTFLQMKTNSWAKTKPLEKFVKKACNCLVISFNVTNKRAESRGKYQVFVRYYQ